MLDGFCSTVELSLRNLFDIGQVINESNFTVDRNVLFLLPAWCGGREKHGEQVPREVLIPRFPHVEKISCKPNTWIQSHETFMRMCNGEKHFSHQDLRMKQTRFGN